MTVGGSDRGMLSAPDGSFELLLPTGVLCEIRAYPDWSEPKIFAIQEVTLDELATPPPLRIQLP